LRRVLPNKPAQKKKMPALTPSFLPPPLAAASPSACFSADSQKSIPPKRDTVAQLVDVSLKPERERVLRVPFMKLEVPAIQEDVAASLAVALLGHVLFLKSQVPLCVVLLYLFT
jgi:hypothetical protein